MALRTTNSPPFQPLAEQHRIVEKVDMLMAEIDELEKKENELEKLKKEFPEDMKVSLLQAAMEGKLTEQARKTEMLMIFWRLLIAKRQSLLKKRRSKSQSFCRKSVRVRFRLIFLITGDG